MANARRRAKKAAKRAELIPGVPSYEGGGTVSSFGDFFNIIGNTISGLANAIAFASTTGGGGGATTPGTPIAASASDELERLRLDLVKREQDLQASSRRLDRELQAAIHEDNLDLQQDIQQEVRRNNRELNQIAILKLEADSAYNDAQIALGNRTLDVNEELERNRQKIGLYETMLQEARLSGDQDIARLAEDRLSRTLQANVDLENRALDVTMRGQDIGSETDRLSQMIRLEEIRRNDALQRGNLELAQSIEQRQGELRQAEQRLTGRGQDVTQRGQDIAAAMEFNQQQLQDAISQRDYAISIGDLAMQQDAENRMRAAQRQQAVLAQASLELESTGLGIQAQTAGGNIEAQIAASLGQTELGRDQMLADLIANPRDWAAYNAALGGGTDFVSQVLQGQAPTGQTFGNIGDQPLLGAAWERLAEQIGDRPDLELYARAAATAGQLGQTELPDLPSRLEMLALGLTPPVHGLPGAPAPWQGQPVNTPRTAPFQPGNLSDVPSAIPEPVNLPPNTPEDERQERERQIQETLAQVGEINARPGGGSLTEILDRWQLEGRQVGGPPPATTHPRPAPAPAAPAPAPPGLRPVPASPDEAEAKMRLDEIIAAGGTLQDYLRERNPQPMAKGGTQIIAEPTVALGMKTGKPYYTTSEVAPERVTIEPLKGGTKMPVQDIIRNPVRPSPEDQFKRYMQTPGASLTGWLEKVNQPAPPSLGDRVADLAQGPLPPGIDPRPRADATPNPLRDRLTALSQGPLPPGIDPRPRTEPPSGTPVATPPNIAPGGPTRPATQPIGGPLGSLRGAPGALTPRERDEQLRRDWPGPPIGGPVGQIPGAPTALPIQPAQPTQDAALAEFQRYIAGGGTLTGWLDRVSGRQQPTPGGIPRFDPVSGGYMQTQGQFNAQPMQISPIGAPQPTSTGFGGGFGAQPQFSSPGEILRRIQMALGPRAMNPNRGLLPSQFDYLGSIISQLGAEPNDFYAAQRRDFPRGMNPATIFRAGF